MKKVRSKLEEIAVERVAGWAVLDREGNAGGSAQRGSASMEARDRKGLVSGESRRRAG
jgi:hypothetical protein